MQKFYIAVATACLVGGCTSTSGYDVSELPDKDTRALCRIVAENPDQNYRAEAANLLVKRGATVDKCARLIQADNTMLAVSVAVAATAVAADAGGGYYPSGGSYGVAWDQFYNEYYQLIWRCRDKATGRFVDDYHCSGKPMVDSTWPAKRA